MRYAARRVRILGGWLGASQAGRRVGSHYNVAVIESDDDLRKLLVEILRDDGNDVAGVRDADGLPRSWRGDVIITDTFASPYRMQDAAAFVLSLRERWRAAVIVLTAHLEALRADAAIGADIVVAKPFELDQFLAVVSETARQHRSTLD